MSPIGGGWEEPQPTRIVGAYLTYISLPEARLVIQTTYLVHLGMLIFSITKVDLASTPCVIGIWKRNVYTPSWLCSRVL